MSTNAGIDLTTMQETLRKHFMRANYQAYIWKNAHVCNPTLPTPDGCGWYFDSSNTLQVDWVDSEHIMPRQLIDILASDCSIEDDFLLFIIVYWFLLEMEYFLCSEFFLIMMKTTKISDEI